MKTLEYINWVKAFAVVSVVMYHTAERLQLSTVDGFISTYFLSIFFYIAGYLTHLKTNWAFIEKKAKRMLIPLISFSIIYVIFLCCWENHSIGFTIKEMLMDDAKRGYWFVYTLFTCMTLVWALNWITAKAPKWLQWVVLSLPWILVVLLPRIMPQSTYYMLSLASFRRYYPFYLFGIISQLPQCQKWMESKWYQRNLVIGYVGLTISYLSTMQQNSASMQFATWMAVNVFGCLFWIEMGKLISEYCKSNVVINALSSDSLGIYLIQFIYLALLLPLMQNLALDTWLIFAIYTVIVLIISLATTWGLRTNKYTRYLFLGN